MGEKIASLYAEIGADTTGLQKGLGQAKTGLTGFKTSLIDVWAGVNLTQQGLAVLSDVIEGTVGITVAYNKQIREMTQVTGLGAEEISRIVQVGDDWGIEIGQVRTALAYLNKQGITPSIDKLAELADSYVAAGDKSKWAKENVKDLGRGYQTLIPILAKGGQALREQTAAIDDSLLATNESIRKAREYEVVLDNWNDAVFGLKMTIGNALLPILTNLLTTQDKIYFQAALIRKETEEGTKVYERRGMVLVDVTDKTGAFASAESKARFAADDLIEGVDDASESLYDMGKAAQTAMEQINAGINTALSDEAKNFDEQQDELYQKLGDVSAEIAKFNTKHYLTDAQKTEIGDLKGELSGVKEQIDNLSGKGDLSARQETRLSTLRDQAKELRDQIDKMGGSKYLTPKQKEELQQLKTEEQEIQAEIKKTADEHELATKRILFDILQQQLAVSGLTKEEMPMAVKALGNLAEGWGLINPATRTAMEAASLFFQSFNGDVDLSQEEIEDLQNAMLGLPSSHKFKVFIDIYANSKISPGDIAALTGKQFGGEVTGGRAYMVGEAGPEILLMPPGSKGEIVPNNKIGKAGGGAISGGGDVYANITINALPGMDENAIANRVIWRLSDVMRYQMAGGGYQGM